MSTPEPEPVPTPPSSKQEARKKRSNMILAVAAVLMVLIPFLFWKGTWFGRPLEDEELAEYLSDRDNPRHVQHALTQIATRIERKDPAVAGWYPQVLALLESPEPELRITLAWMLGSDNGSEDFREALLQLLDDPELLVRRNAALSLVRFGDDSGHEEIVQMLRPYTLLAPVAGTFRSRVEQGQTVEGGTVIGRVERGPEDLVDVKTPIPGTLEQLLAQEGDTVAENALLARLAPGEQHVWEGLRALLLIGKPEDLPLIQRVTRNGDLPQGVRQQAMLTADQIRQSHPERE